MITKGSKIRLVEPIGCLTKGMIFEVTQVDEHCVIFRPDSNTNCGMYGCGYMSFKEYRKHFEEYEEVENDFPHKGEWSNWELYNDIEIHKNYLGQSERYLTITRTNGKVVEVSTDKGKNKLVGKAYCSPNDRFDLIKGRNLAYLRLCTKLARRKERLYVESLP